jgi:hypothetical protein
MTTELTDSSAFIAAYQNNTVLWPKIVSMTNYIVAQVAADMAPVKYKYTSPPQVGNAGIQQIIIERGYSYIADVMGTIQGVDFTTMLYFAHLIGNLKGTTVGMQLVLQLMGFDSIITEWWQATPGSAQPWTYKITVIVDESNVPNLYTTLAALKVFSYNYVFALISDIELEFSAVNFATDVAIMGGFVHQRRFGSIVQRLPA